MSQQRRFLKWEGVVARCAAVSLACAAIATAWPNRWVYAVTVVPAFLCGAYAAGFGLYGIMRYPSLRMLFVSTAAVIACAWSTVLFVRIASLPAYTKAA